MSRVSAVMIVKNGERTLERALRSAAFCDELVVVDSGSTDRSRQIAAAAGAKVFERTFDTFSDQKNHAVSKASCEWVFSIDADEEITPELAAEIRAAVNRTGAGAPAGYRVLRRTLFMGRLLRFGGHQSDRPVRLFRKSAGAFAGKVHEEVRVEGAVERLRSPLMHYTTPDAREYLRKLNHYTDLEAETLRDRGTEGRGAARPGDLWLKPAARFCQKYFLQLGLADGWAGFVYAFLSAYYEFVRLAKFWQKPHNLSANI